MHLVQRGLVIGIGVDGGHIAALDAEQVVQHLGDGGQGVGGARTVRNDDVVGGQGVVVDLVDDGLVGVVAGRADQDPLGAGRQVGAGLVLGGEDAGALEGDVHLQLGVRQVGGVALGRDLDLARADIDPILARGHRAGEAAVDRIVAEQVGVGLDRTQIVDRHNLDIRAARFDDGAQDVAADAAKSIDGNLDGHGVPFLGCDSRMLR